MKRRLILKTGALLLAGCSGTAVHTPVATRHRPRTDFLLPIPDYEQMALKDRMQHEGFALGAKTYLRIFKEESTLEAWMLRADGQYHLYRKFPICTYSGELGPKQREGDRQAPEGFYEVAARQMNPNSQYHLSFNLGFPNAYDRSQGYTGSHLMVHGDCVSIGCYAMDDRQIETIYAIVSAAHQRGQYSVPVHAFPFEMTHENMMRHADNEWMGFWQMLQPGYDYFERERIPPRINVLAGRYEIGEPFEPAIMGRLVAQSGA